MREWETDYLQFWLAVGGGMYLIMRFVMKWLDKEKHLKSGRTAIIYSQTQHLRSKSSAIHVQEKEQSVWDVCCRWGSLIAYISIRV